MRPLTVWWSRIILLLVVMVGCLSPEASAVVWQRTPEVLCDVDRSDVYMGEAFTYRVFLNHVPNAQRPKIEWPVGLRTKEAGERSVNSSSTTIINGRVSETVRRGTQYEWTVMPQEAGIISIPAPDVTVDGRSFRGREIRINVTAPDQQDDVILQVDVSPASVYPMQPFEVTVRLLVQPLPEPYSNRDPLSVQNSPPRLEMPWFEKQVASAEIEPLRPVEEVLNEIGTARSAGVSVNGFEQQSVFSLMGRRPLTFLPQSETVTARGADGIEREYREYRFARRFRSRTTGELDLGQAAIKGTFATDTDGRSLIGKDYFSVSEPVRMTIKDVPSEGRPSNYTGAIGQFSVASSVTPQKARVGEPVTYTMALIGEGTVNEIIAPDLRAEPQITGQFRVYDPTAETDADRRTFTWSVRPLHEGIEEFPPVSISYFDVEQEAYVQLEAPAVPLTISAAARLTAEDIAGGSSSATSDSPVTDRDEWGLLADVQPLRTFPRTWTNLNEWLPLWGGITAATSLAWGLLPLIRRGNGETDRRRRRRAFAEARRNINHWRREPGQTSDPVAEAFRRCISEIRGADTGECTTPECHDHLMGLQLPASLIEETVHWLQTQDAGRYGGADSHGNVADQAEQLLSRIESSLRGTSR